MRRLTVLALGAALAACGPDDTTGPAAPPTSPAFNQSGSAEAVVPGRVLAKFQPGANASQIAAAAGAQVERPLVLGIQVLSVPVGAERAVARALSNNPNVRFAEPDYIRTFGTAACGSSTGSCVLPTDAYFGYKWDHHNDGTITTSSGTDEMATGKVDADIDWLEAHDQLGAGYTGSAIVGIVDSGILPTHEELSGKVLAMADFYGSTSGADDYGHGTHVAGIAAANTNNSVGVSGVGYSPSIKVVSAKVCGYYTPVSYGCSTSAITSGIKWAADQGAKAINLSLGGASGSSSEQEALQYALNKGALPLCATGNDNGVVSYPAAFPECVAVGATDWSDNRASYSNYGPETELAAPGGDDEDSQTGRSYILSSCYDSNTAYCFMAGTSMATPQATGLAALLASLGVASPADIRSLLQSTADDLGPAGRDDAFGYGRINAYQAVLAAQGGGGGTTNSAPTASFTYACTELSCSFDGSGSTDSDGTIASYAWAFGDGATASGATASHTYAAGGTYTVTLTVTDDAGATGSQSQSVTVSSSTSGGITLSASGYKVKGVQHADLSWSGATSTSVDVYRDGARIATTANDGAYTNNINRRGGGSYTYKVCEAGTSTCSNNATVTF